VLELWEDAEVHLDTDTCLLATKEGVVVGYSGVFQSSDCFTLDPHSHVHQGYQQRGLEHYLLRFIEKRVGQIVQADPTLPAVIQAQSFSPTWTNILQQEGYHLCSSEWRMEVVLQTAPPPPSPVEGIVIRPYLPGKEEPVIHAVITEAFSDIGGRPATSFEDWRDGVLGRSSFDASLLYVALAEDRIVGAIVCFSYPELHQGHICQVAVLRPWRRHGIARHLLSIIFGESYRRGMKSVILDVDAHNATGAHQLYHQAGLRKIFQIDNLEKALA
jgi:ribosomal protein S18 acetylase RimI-like enzyme